MSKARYTVAAGRPLTELVRVCYRAGLPVMLRGHTGVGKSEILEAFAREERLGYLCRDLSLMEPPDLVGMPQVEKGRTRFLPPAFLPDGGKGLLVLEEVNRAPEYMRGPCLQLLSARCLNDYVLPPGWLPVAAINPAEDGYDAAELDPALLARFVQIVVVPDRGHWLDWARGHGVHQHVLDYVEAEPGAFEGRESNPRAWTYVSRLLQANSSLNGDEVTPTQLKALVAGCVGPERAAAFFRFIKDRVAPMTAEEVLGAYGSKGRRQVNSWLDGGKLDLVEGTLRNVEVHVQSATDFERVKGDAKQWANLGRFLSDLPGDLLDRAKTFFQENDYPLPDLTGPAKKGRRKP
jgi:hypothetical protein